VTQSQVMSILMHGDAAFAGQGVVYETMVRVHALLSQPFMSLTLLSTSFEGFASVSAAASGCALTFRSLIFLSPEVLTLVCLYLHRGWPD
jgi:hypothetical protein